MKELVNLLSSYKFQIDKQNELLEAFREIDQDADDRIPRSELEKFLRSMGEPLEDFEVKHLVKLCEDTGDKNQIDIVKLSQIMIPSDDIIGDLTMKIAKENEEKMAAFSKMSPQQ